MSSLTMDQSSDEARTNSPTEQQSDADFLCPLELVTSPNDVISSSWMKLVHSSIHAKPSAGRRCRRLQHPDPYPQSPVRSDENSSSSRPTRRTLFGGGRDSPVSSPLRDVGNVTPRSTGGAFRRYVSDTAAADRDRPRPTPLSKSRSMTTTVLTSILDNDDHRLVGDFTRLLCLPVLSDGKHCDLNSISHDTVGLCV